MGNLLHKAEPHWQKRRENVAACNFDCQGLTAQFRCRPGIAPDNIIFTANQADGSPAKLCKAISKRAPISGAPCTSGMNSQP